MEGRSRQNGRISEAITLYNTRRISRNTRDVSVPGTANEAG